MLLSIPALLASRTASTVAAIELVGGVAVVDVKTPVVDDVAEVANVLVLMSVASVVDCVASVVVNTGSDQQLA